MANTIKIRRSAVQGAIPTTSQLALGELALNTYDGKLFTKKSVGGSESIVELSAGTGGGGSGVLNELDGDAASSVYSSSLTSLDGGGA